MATQVQYRRGTSTQNDAFTGALAEITVDTTNKVLRVHDGITAGGFSLAGLTATQTLTNKTLTSPTLTTAVLSGTQTGSANLTLTGLVSVTGNIDGGNLRTAGLVTATGNVIGGNITTVGQVSATGNVTGAFLLGNASFVTGLSASKIFNGTSEANVGTSGGNANISIGGTSNVAVFASTGLFVTGLASATGNITGGNINTAGQVSATGNVTGAFLLGNASFVTGLSASKIFNGTSEANIGTSGGNANISIAGTSNVAVFASTGVFVTGLISATGNITGGNLSGTSIAGTLTTAAQTNITSVGTLGSLTVSGNISGGNISTAGNLAAPTASGNTNTTQVATTAYVIGQAGGATPGAVGTAAVGTSSRYAREDHTHSGVTNITTSSGLSTNTNATGAVSITNTGVTSAVAGTGISVSGATGAVTITNSGVTSVNGSTGAVTGIATTGATLAQFAATTSAQLAGVISDETGSGSLVFATSPTLTTPILGTPQSGTLTSCTGLPISTGVSGLGTGIATFLGTPSSTNLASAVTDETGSGSLVFATSPTLTTPNIGAATGTSLNISTGTVTCGSIVNANANGVGNIGSSTTYFNTVFAKATSAQYADVAEKYQADANYPVGTVLIFGGDKEVTISTQLCDSRIAGTVSENPAYVMNNGLIGPNVSVVALLGRVPCRVIGIVNKGDILVSSDVAGTARKLQPGEYQPGCIIGKALESYNNNEPGIIEIVVGRF